MKQFTKKFFVLVVVMLICSLGMVACGESTKITLKMQEEAIVEIGTSIVLEPEVSDETHDPIEWSSDNVEIATVNDGVVTGVSKGTVKITAKIGSESAICTVTVKEAVKISLDPVSIQMVEGNTAKILATIEGTEEKVVWTSSDENIVTVDNDGTVHGIKEGTATVTATVNDKKAVCEITVLGINITLSSENMTLYLGTENISIKAEVQNGEVSQIVWSSSNDNVLTVDGEGTINLIGEGTANIVATIGQKSATCIVTVVKPTIVLPEIVELFKTKTMQLTPDVGDCALPVVWTSQNEGVVTVSEDGLIEAKEVGETTITAKIGTVETSVVVKVKEVPSLSLDNTTLVLDKGGVTEENFANLTLTVNGVENKDVTWTSDADSVATVEKGTVRAVSAGKVNITADYFGFTVTCEVEVKDYTGYLLVQTAHQFDKAIHPNGTNVVTQNIVLGNDIDMGGMDLSYNPYNLNAIIDGNGYTISNFTVGCKTLREYIDHNIWNGNLNKALFWDILSGGVIRNIAVKNVVGYFGSNCGVFAIKNLGTIENVYLETELNNRDWATQRVGGLVGTMSGGTIRNCIVVAKAYTKEEMKNKTLQELGEATEAGAFCKGYDGADLPELGVAAQGILVGRIDGGTVENCIAVSKDSDPNLDIFGGYLFGTKSQEGSYNNCALKSEEDLKKTETFSNEWDKSIWKLEEGNLPSLNNAGKKAPVIVEFLDFNNLFINNQATVKAVTNGTENIVYASNNQEIATIDENGLITAVAPGKVIISATSSSVTAELEIEIPFVFNDVSSKRIKIGERIELGYTVSNLDEVITWTSSNDNIAMVEDGVVAAKGDGEVVISAKVGDRIVKLTTISVYSVQISLDSESKGIYEGNEFTLKATVKNADESQIIWTSDNETVAKVANGKVTALTAGVANITATVDGVSATCVVNVKKVPNFKLDKNELKLDVQGFACNKTGNLSVVIEETETPVITWSSKDDKVATVENGVVTAVGNGRTKIVAEVYGATVECDVIVKDYAGYNAVNDETSLRAIKNATNAKYVLTSDIDLKGVYLDNLGDLTGILDGNGHTISNFTLGAKSLQDWLALGEFSWDQKLWQGLFTGISGGTVCDLSLKGVTAFFSNCCGVVTASNFGTIENVFVEVALYNRGWATRDVGGIAGVNGTYNGNTGVIKNCIVVASSKTNEEMQAWIAEVTGDNSHAKRGFCKGYDGDDLPEDGARSQGLLVGRLDGEATVENCFAVSKESDPNLDIFDGNLFGIRYKQGTNCALKTEEELKDSALFAQNWDLTIWQIEEGVLPKLRLW